MGNNGSRKGAKAQRRRLSLFFAPLRLCVSLLLFTLILSPAFAQQRNAPKEKDKERRAKAVELIVETADAARTFKDLYYRARIQTLAADTLWPHDAERARQIFRRAWEAATAFDKAEQQAEESESGVPSTLPITEARDEVLGKAAARDSKLAEAFLKDLLAEKSEEKNAGETQTSETQANNTRRTPWHELSAQGLRRLALALELLNRNEPARAAEIALPVVSEGASADLLAFILRLRDESAADADALYVRLLERVGRDATADANDVLLLSAPLFSPQLLVVVDAQGALQYRPVPRSSGSSSASQTFAPVVRNAFYNVAANILLRPLVPRAGGAGMTPEAIALYFTIGRLLPFFEREAPQHLENLRLRSSNLAGEIEAGRRERLSQQFELSSLTQERPGDPLRAQLDQVGRARDAQDRDRILLGIVRKASQFRLWDRARRAAAEIEDVNTRRAALSFLAVTQIADLLHTFQDDKEDNFDNLASFVRKADVPPLAGAWGMAQTAVMAASKGKTERAQALLDEAASYAARTSAGTRERVTAYIVLTRMAARVDAKRAWELLPEVVRAANAVEDYAGDEMSIEIALDESQAVEASEPLSVEADVFRLDGIFATMARLDYEKAQAAARSLRPETPQAFAMLAIARTMLNTEARRSKESDF